MLPTLQAEQQLRAIEAASVPHLAEQGRRELLGRYRRLLAREQPARSAHEALMRAGVRVVHVAAAEPAAPATGRDRTRRKDEHV